MPSSCRTRVDRWQDRDVEDESATRRTGRQRGSEWDGIFAAKEGSGLGWDREVRRSTAAACSGL